MQKYEFVLKNEKIRLYNRITKNAIFLNAVILLSFCFSSFADKKGIIIAATAIFIILSGFFFINKFYSSNSKWGVGYVVIFDLLAVTWILLGFYWVAEVQLLFSFLSTLAVKKIGIHFNEDRVMIYSIPQRKILWEQLTNVVLKDGLLTLDFKNNKIFQQLIDEKIQIINEKEFNDFCNQQLVAGSQQQTT